MAFKGFLLLRLFLALSILSTPDCFTEMMVYSRLRPWAHSFQSKLDDELLCQQKRQLLIPVLSDLM